MVCVRPAKPKDHETLTQIKRAALRSHGVTPRNPRPPKVPHTSPEQRSDCEPTVIVAEQDITIGGWGCLYLEPEPIGVVFIDPSMDTTEMSDAIVDRLQTLARVDRTNSMRVHLY